MNKIITDKIDQHFRQYDTRTYAKGEVIILANQEPESISLLRTGIVEQYDITPDGNKIVVNIFKTPAYFPMSWAINKTPNTYFFGAVTDVTLQQADPAATVAFLQANPDVMFDLLSRVYTGTDALLRRLALAASGVAAHRLIFELLLEAYRFGVPGQDDQTLLLINQSGLAARSGLARETVSRELHKLERQQLLALTKQGIAIDPATLEKQLHISA
jgi:CRP-like cAMP-binding protein